MWTRKELKTRAKEALKENYWRSVLVALILTAVTASGTVIFSSGSGGVVGGSIAGRVLPHPKDPHKVEMNVNEADKEKEAAPVSGAAENEAAAEATAGTEAEAPADGTVDAEAAKTDDAANAEAVTEAAKTDDAANAEAGTEAAKADGAANAEAGAEGVAVADSQADEIPPLDLSEYGIDKDFDYEAVRTDPNATVKDLLKLAGVPEQQAEDIDQREVMILIAMILAIVFGIILIACIISFLIRLLILNPLMVGCRAFYMLNSRTKSASIIAVERGFTPKYGRNVGAILLMDIYQALWTALFIIPGIIKAYSYRMVPYILADDPDVGANEAITRSRMMMKGNKWRAFVLDLSFILWDLLSVITFGLVGVFYVNPYIFSTNAELYNALKGEAQSTETSTDEAN